MDSAQEELPEEVKLVSEHPQWKRAWTHAELEPLYNVSLYPDLAVFRERVRLPSALGIANQLRKYHLNNTRTRRGTAVVVVRSGRVLAVTPDDFNPAFRIRVDSVVTELQRHQDAGHVALPDTIFILNARDVPLCSLGFCLVPLFSPVKEVRGLGGSMGPDMPPHGKAYNEDLLVPLLAYPHEQLVFYPAEKKIPLGAFASDPSEPLGGESSCRAFVSRFARDSSVGGKVLKMLDARELLEQQQRAGQGGEAAAATAAPLGGAVSGMASTPPPAVPLSRYRVAVSCDVQSANPGLASLLHTNTPVLKGRSNWAEYYYRAMRAVKEALKPSAAARMAMVAEAGQRFAYTYLSLRSRVLYYEKAITEYNSLFGPGYMQATVADLPSSRPITFGDILALRMYPSSWRQGLA
ncbi:hypothetical protein GPECTOR_6g659 [Gonium pectorale]|uniref:Uncharacterized protein n=1 Tax=Gonium pectorale TaxID=33097 RepID=A0A150GVL5_GONPE|nr:hypothetical protein GPECTOR_6g659 [Gonium pectorale]|eukprot:KXZ53742.1 hypothetical protein GPECTOR_6g659 [Gonium pectorale]